LIGGELSNRRVVIVGAGQAGLAMGHSLIQVGLEPQRDFVLIDSGRHDGLAWNRRWDSLQLFTAARDSSLPGLPLAGGDRYPRGGEIGAYLQRYAARFGLKPRWRVTAHSVSSAPHGHGLRLKTNVGVIETRNVVAATGPFSRPRYPQFAPVVAVPGLNIHSDDYRNPRQVPPGDVLIVGAGNTGMQLAHELSDTHRVVLAAGSPRRTLPAAVAGVGTLRLLRASGALSLPVATWLGRRLSAAEPVIGRTVENLRWRGVRVTGRVAGARGAEFRIDGGEVLEVQSVIWATGYAHGASWLPESLHEANGDIRQRRGVTAVPGLFTVGLPWMHTRGSALLGGVGRDAAHLSRMIARRP
jgi:putative flavoprotein involved in K+ transport